MSSFAQRVLRASLLHADTYEEVEADKGATLQAGVVVGASALGAGIGCFEYGGVTGILAIAAVALAGWFVWAALTCTIGTKLLPGPHTSADLGELLRTIGFSTAPGVLRVFAIVPAIAGPVFWICTLWMLVAMVVAVRQALDYEGTGRAIAVCAIGFPVYVIPIFVALLFTGPWPI